jgi:thymidylate kinase
MKKIHHIAITGGPCAGKSSTLPYLQKKLTSLGYKVITMPEMASTICRIAN